MNKIILTIILLLSLSGCGGANTDLYNEAGTNDDVSQSVENGLTSTGDTDYSDKTNPYIIVTGKMSLETKDFSKTYETLAKSVKENDGYFSNSYEEKQYNPATGENDGNMYGEYTIRIPSENFYDFTDSVTEKTKVIEKTINTEDISEKYTDTEGRLKTLQAERDRLLEFMEQAEEMADLITLEEKLAEINYEIENYQSSLNSFDNKIKYSTINITIQEAKEYTAMKSETFIEKLYTSFVTGVSNFVDVIQSFMIEISYNIIGLTINGIYIYVLFKKIKKGAYFANPRSILISFISVLTTSLLDMTLVGIIFTLVTAVLVIKNRKM